MKLLCHRLWTVFLLSLSFSLSSLILFYVGYYLFWTITTNLYETRKTFLILSNRSILSDTSLLFFFFYCLLAFSMPLDCTSFQLFCFSALSFWSLIILLYRPIGPYLFSIDFAFLLLLSLTYCPIGLYLLFLDFSVRIFLFSYLFCLSLFVSLI